MTSRLSSRLFPVLALLAVACLGAFLAAPNARATTLRPLPDHVTVALAPGDSITITGFWHLTGNTTGLDSIGTTLEQPVGVVFAAKAVGPSVTTVSYGMSRPGTAISGKLCVAKLYVGSTTFTPNSCLSWTYTPPGAVADSVKVARLWIEPKSMTVMAGGTIQYCTFIVFADSMVAMRDQDALVCDTLWNRVPLARRTYGAGARQAVADATCLQYTVVGPAPVAGTITSETCPAPSGGGGRSS